MAKAAIDKQQDTCMLQPSEKPPIQLIMFRLPITLVCFLAAIMLMISYLEIGQRLDIPGKNITSIVLFLLGSIVIGLCGQAFRKRNTTIDPVTPENTRTLVTTGLYRFSRNPMYLGFLLWLMAGAVFLSYWVNVLLLPLFIISANRLYILPEERALLKSFNAEYRAYQQRVRRWL